MTDWSASSAAMTFMIPMAIGELRAMSEVERDRMAKLWTSADVVDQLAGSGDMMWGTGSRATRADHRAVGEALTAAARAAAVASFLPGGVCLFGALWCGRHAPWGTTGASCAGCVVPS